MTCDKCHKEIEGTPITGGFIKGGVYKVGEPLSIEQPFTICKACADAVGIRTEAQGKTI